MIFYLFILCVFAVYVGREAEKSGKGARRFTWISMKLFKNKGKSF